MEGKIDLNHRIAYSSTIYLLSRCSPERRDLQFARFERLYSGSRGLKMIPYFKNLGQQIKQAWLERSYDEEVFPQLAFDALERDSPTRHAEVVDIVDWVFSPSQDSGSRATGLIEASLASRRCCSSRLEGMSGKETIGFDFNDVNRLIFRGLVEGLDTEGLLERLRGVCRDESIEASRDRLLAHAKQLAKSDLFYPLLSSSPLRRDSRDMRR